MKKYIIMSLIGCMIGFSACESYLDVYPDDQITSLIMWNEAEDADLALNGAYSVLTSLFLYGYGPGIDACTPNAYQWANWETYMAQVGNGSINANSAYIVPYRWRDCYKLVYRTNYILENIDLIPEIDPGEKERIIGETYFLRGIAYDLLARTYGGVPIITKNLENAAAYKQLTRSTIEQTWEQVHKDFDEAIKRLPVDGKDGQATLGSAYGMKMKAYLYTSEWDQVLDYCDKIDALGKYRLFPSYQGLFQYENEGNAETLFAVSFMSGPNQQGSIFDRFFQPQNLKYGMDGSNSVAPTQLLVDEYETIDGSPVDPYNPYDNRDPRLDFTVLRPGAYFQGQLYPDEIKNHTGQLVGFGIRKYTIETMVVVERQSSLDFMVIRYGDVLLCRAEALIEKNRDIDVAIDIINRIRTERDDVKITLIPKGLSQVEARKVLRHERRIELALEGQFWDDIKRWNAGPEFYPCEVISGLGSRIEIKFPNGYNLERDNLLPIPSDEISHNPKLKQNPGY